jgi:hypothetical protein
VATTKNKRGLQLFKRKPEGAKEESTTGAAAIEGPDGGKLSTSRERERIVFRPRRIRSALL